MARLITFGGLSVRNGTVLNGAANPRTRLAVLAVIAAAGETGVRREKLLALFWPESDEERARNALRQAIFAMRRDLGGVDLTIGSADLRLNPQVLTSDVGDFDCAIEERRFEDAVALYAGPFLDGVFVRDSAEFEHWADEQRQRLSALYGQALDALATGAVQRGDHVAAVQWRRRRAVHDPLSARVARGYIEALAAAGDRETAIRHAAVYAQLVRGQLDAEPDAEVMNLAQSLRTQPAAALSVSAAPDVALAPVDDAPVDAQPTPVTRSDVAIGAPRRSLARLKAAAVVIAVVGAAAWYVAHRADASATLVMIVPFENITGDSAMAAIGVVAANRISEGLALTHAAPVVDFQIALERLRTQKDRPSTSRLDLARAMNASTLVEGTIARDGDSLRFESRVVRVRDGSVVAQIEPVRFSAADPSRAIEQLGARVTGVFAASTDDRFVPWANAVSAPPRYDAYLEFAAGLEAMARGEGSPETRFKRAAQLDTTFLQAKLMAVADDGTEGSYLFADSILAAAERHRDRYTPYDRAALDEAIGFHTGNWEASYLAAREMVSLAPWSRQAHMRLINDAMGTMRYHEAIDEYHQLNRNGWINEWEYFWNGEVGAHHHAGDYEGELREARAALAQHPRSAGLCSLQIRPLAALGREAAIDSVITYCVSLSSGLSTVALGLSAGRELYAHLYREAARRVLARARRDALAANPQRTAALAQIGMYSGDWKPMFDASAQRIARDTTDYRSYGQHGVAAAHLGDTAAAGAMARHIASLRLRSGNGQPELWRGFIAAAVGDRGSAAELLREAVEKGTSPTWFFHYNAVYLEPLRGYAPFETLARTRPVDHRKG